MARAAGRRGVGKALALGPRPITPAARAGIVLGLAPAFWSEFRLARYVRTQAVAAGHPSAPWVQHGTMSQLLAEPALPPPDDRLSATPGSRLRCQASRIRV
jgi:hypothetical protein